MHSRGFTLVELMVVVAILGILAAVAIPQYLLFSRKADRAEGMFALDTWHKGEMSYFANYAHFTVTPPEIEIDQDHTTAHGWHFSTLLFLPSGSNNPGGSNQYTIRARKDFAPFGSEDYDQFIIKHGDTITPLTCPGDIPVLWHDSITQRFLC